jgi:hypothetical protein
LCGFFAFNPFHFKKTVHLSSFIKYNWLILLKSHFYAQKGILSIIIIAIFYHLSIFYAFFYKKFHFYYEFNKKLVILDMRMQKTTSYLMPMALISVPNTGKHSLYIYDSCLNAENNNTFSKYYYLKSILIKSTRFIRQLLFPDHGFG